MRGFRGTLVVLALLLGAVPLSAQSPFGPQDHPLRIELGRFLFESPLLSEGGAVSCVTCHDPKRSFADGRADAVGRLGIGIGRNSPTLFSIGLISHFRDPDQARRARPGRRPRILTLEARCLAPLSNELEMGSGPEHAVKALRKVPHLPQRFDRAFGGSGGGVTVDRTGKALAAFLRSLAPPRAPYRRFLAGDREALEPAAKRGLHVFGNKGRCAACHGGPSLSDGLMHVVDPPEGARIRARRDLALRRRVELLRREYARKERGRVDLSTNALATDATRFAAQLPGGGGYDADQLEVQTATLWDVARTAPYFRDGSVSDLEEAVVRHLEEMATVAEETKAVRHALLSLEKAGKRAPRRLRPREAVRDTPRTLSPQELADLLAFLKALSPSR